MKIRCDIEGLDCPHCAAKLESMLAADAAFKSASINFPLKSLVLEADDAADEDGCVAVAMKIAADFEDGITISLRD